MNNPNQFTKRRYSPEVRRSMILDHACKIVAHEGVAGISLDRICREAEISKSLIYRYFENLTELLRELLDRELSALRKEQFAGAKRATTFEELVRNITHVYINYIDERGLIIERLQNEPSVSQSHNPTDYDRDSSVLYISKIVEDQFGIPQKVARAMTDISFGLPAAAGDYLSRGELSKQEVEDITVSMIIGSVTAVYKDYLTRIKKL